MHADAIHLMGSCHCPCHHLTGHRLREAACWCEPACTRTWPTEAEVDELRGILSGTSARIDPPAVAHNDALTAFGRCTSPHHTGPGPATCRSYTAPELRRGLEHLAERDLQRRLRSGRATPAEYLRHAPWVLMGRPKR